MNSFFNNRFFYMLFFFAMASGIVFGLNSKIWGAVIANHWTICHVNCDFTSLQAAVNASEVQNGDTLQIKFNDVHTETNILVDKNLTFSGLGETVTTIQAAGDVMSATHRIFTILDGVDVTIQDMTLRHGNAYSVESNPRGGAIWVGDGNLTLSDVVIRDNRATYGGAIASLGGSVTIINSYIRNNYAVIDGGGIYSENTALNLSDGGEFEYTIRHNEAGWRGGGIYHQNGAFSLSNYAVRQNKAEQRGGGLFIAADTPATIDHGLIIDNRLDNNDTVSSICEGGGLYSNVDMTISNSIFDFNLATASGSNGCDGGAIFVPNQGSDLLITNTDLVHNRLNPGSSSGTSTGGAIYFQGEELTVTNSSLDSNEGVYGSALIALGDNHTLTNVQMHSNDGGPAIFLRGGKNMELIQVDMWQNESGREGGAIHLSTYNPDAEGTLKISHSTIRENTAAIGGALYLRGHADVPEPFATNVEIEHTQILSNTAVVVSENGLPGDGGGVWMSGVNLHMIQSLVAGNQAENHGGGFYIHEDYFGHNVVAPTNLNVYNSTISRNGAIHNGGGMATGAATSATAVVYLRSSTVTQNTADLNGTGPENGGGIYNASAFVNVELGNTILAGNSDSSPTFAKRGPDCVGVYFSSNGYNIIGTLGSGGPFLPPNPAPPPPCAVQTSTGDQVGVLAADLALGDLQDNGGETFTHALLAGSVAINAGDVNGCSEPDQTPIVADQRDYGRVDRCDIGAYEYNGLMPTPSPTPSPTATVSPNATVTPVATPTGTSTPPINNKASVYLPLLRR